MVGHPRITEHTTCGVLQIGICVVSRRMVDEKTRQSEYQRFLYLIHHTERAILHSVLADTGSRNCDDPRYRMTYHVSICRSENQVCPTNIVLMIVGVIVCRKHSRHGKRKILVYPKKIHLFPEL